MRFNFAYLKNTLINNNKIKHYQMNYYYKKMILIEC